MSSDPIRAVVADDHPAVLRSVCDVLIDAGVDVVARASNGEEAAAKIEATRPAVALLDFDFGTIDHWWSGNVDIGKGIADLKTKLN